MLESGTEKRSRPFQFITRKEGFFKNALIFYFLIFNTSSFPGYLNSFNSLFQGWSIQSKTPLRGSQTQDKKKEEKSDRGPQGTTTTETSKVIENRTLTKQDRKKESFTLQSSISKKQLIF